jgi:putative transposase
MAKRRRHTPDQIIRKLAEGNKLLAGGAGLDEVCRHLQVAESTWHRWVAQYGGLKASDAKRLKELEGENARSRSCWRRPSWTRRCSRRSRRETSDPEPAAACGLHAVRAVRGLPATSLPGPRPAPFDPTAGAAGADR